jgi:pyrrolidone-carboxylate peptidase
LSAEPSRVIVTGFGPFGEVHLNASGIVAERLDGVRLGGGLPVRGVVLPTAYGEARARMAELARAPGTCAILALGVWRGGDVRLERRARGVVTSDKSDVRGEVWSGRVLGTDQVTRLPLGDWAEALGVALSEDCGGFVCNATYHALLEALGEAPNGLFLHVPRDVGERGLAGTGRVVLRVLTRLFAHLELR